MELVEAEATEGAGGQAFPPQPCRAPCLEQALQALVPGPWEPEFP